MSVLKRLIPYILLNIIVSAAATFAVLTWWSNGRPLPQGLGASAVPTQTQASATGLPASTPLPADAKVVEIPAVAGAGNLNAESVTVKRVGQGELRMNGWRLEDSAGHKFDFPDIILFANGAVQVFTRAGTNTVNELYWGLSEAVWSSGKTISLFDNQGILRATLVVP